MTIVQASFLFVGLIVLFLASLRLVYFFRVYEFQDLNQRKIGRIMAAFSTQNFNSKGAILNWPELSGVPCEQCENKKEKSGNIKTDIGVLKFLGFWKWTE